MTTEDTFWKLKNFIDLCYEKNDLDVDDVLSMLVSNFDGKEVMEFRKEQKRISK